MEGGGELEDSRLSHAGEAYHTHDCRQDITGDDAYEDGGQFQDPSGKMVKPCDYCQSEGGYGPVLPGTVGGASGSSGHVVDGRGVQGEADGKYHGSGDDGREQRPDFLHGQADDDGYDSSHQLGSQDGGHVEALCDGLHAGDVGEADAHDHRQSAPKLKSKALFRSAGLARGTLNKRKQLEKGADGGHHQGRLDQKHPIPAVKARGSCHDDGGSDAAHDHGHHMLEGQRKGLGHGRYAVQFKDGGSRFPGFHHWLPPVLKAGGNAGACLSLNSLLCLFQ